MLLQTFKAKHFNGTAKVPSSKPETQRAIIAATLVKGKSIIFNHLRCLETKTMKQACRHVGAEIIEKEDHLEIQGVGNKLKRSEQIIDALGSGLVLRVMTALTCFSDSQTILTGDKVLKGRVMAPLLSALAELGANIDSIVDSSRAPLVNWGKKLQGGEISIEGNISSQFITAILLAAPMSEQKTTINIKGEILSLSYIKQTLETMKKTDITVTSNNDFSVITVEPSLYKPSEFFINGDFTSLSYLIVAAAIHSGRTVFQNLNSASLQGERKIIDIVQTLGIGIEFNDKANELYVTSPSASLTGDYEFDASDYPNIIPTLAALGCYVNGTFRVIGGSITRLHKSSRIEAMVSELKKMGVDINPILKNGVYDGFEIHGKDNYQGGTILSSWGDHRIFMSLFITSLRCHSSNFIDGYDDVHCSFPDFFQQVENLGGRSTEINKQALNDQTIETDEENTLISQSA